MLKKCRVIQYYLTAIILIGLIQACTYGTPDPEPVPQTEILEIRLTPDTVAVGDTVLIHCLIKDSLDTRFNFFWNLDKERTVSVNGKIDGPRIKWWAKGFEYLELGEVQSLTTSVRVDNNSEDSVSVTEVFQIDIKNAN